MEPSPLVYDTAAAAAVWQRVGPALPAYDAAPCPAGACCPLPRRETDSEATFLWSEADARQGEKGKKQRKDTLAGVFALVDRW